jgi:hypothetical protein
MGKEARESKKIQEIGKYNVKITLLFMRPNDGNMMTEAIPCKTWVHSGPFLALTLFDGTLRLVNLSRYMGFSVNELNLEEFKEDGEQEN